MRSASVSDDVRASAANVLACRPTVTAPAAASSISVADTIDAWVADFVHVRTGSLAPAMGATGCKQVEPSTAGKNAGAVQAAVDRVFGHPLPWALTREARNECGCEDRRRGGEHRTTKTSILPREVWITFGRSKPTGNLTARRNVAAMATATVFGGLPVSTMLQIKPDELDVQNFEGQPAGILRFTGKRKVHRNRRVPRSYRATTYAGASPMISTIIEPWLARAIAGKWTYLFPCIANGRVMKAKTMSHGDLEEFAKLSFDGATWHGLRSGFSRAIDLVHRVPGGPGTKVPDAVVNAAEGRSNMQIRGSHDVYTQDSAEELWRATGAIHRVDTVDVNGISRLRAYDVVCAVCESEVDYDDFDATLCEEGFCSRVRCVECSGGGVENDFFCGDHQP